MTLTEIMSDKSIKKLQARTMIIDGIMQGNITIEEIEAASAELKDSRFSAVLEAVEEISNKGLTNLSADYLELAKRYVSCGDNSCKRESSRIIGNLAPQYPEALEDCIPALLDNAKSEGTVIRWGSAYALSRIVLLKEYRDSDLYERLVSICDSEQENGVKNQYLKALRKIKK